MSSEKKHILILPRWYPNKTDIQLGIFIKNQALLLKNDFEISVIYVQSDSDIKNDFEIKENRHEGIYEQIVYFKKSKSLFKKIINFKRYKTAQVLAYSKLESEVDLCHVHVPIRPSFLARKLLKEKNIPFVITEHWSGHLTGEFLLKSGIYKAIYKRTLKSATKISCVSEFLKLQFEKNTGFVPTVLPNYIEKIEVEKPFTSKSETIHILSVNDFIDSIKNISGLLHAFKNAVIGNPNLQLTLIGGGPDEVKIQSLIQSLAFKKNEVLLLGRLAHQEVLKQMTHCDFYISNSNFETFGMTICEALLCGKPVISTLSGGPNEFLNESNSITINKNDSNQLTISILKMSKIYSTFNSGHIAEQITKSYGRKSVREKTIKFYAE